jgi:hypothetical protein
MRLLISIIFFYCASHAYAQSPRKIEQELLVSFKQLQHNTEFRNSLLSYTATVKSTFTYGFKELEKEGLVVRTSDDGLFRIYSWDTQTGGTAHNFDAVIQYKVGNDLFSQPAGHDANETGKWYSNIYMLKTDSITYYIGLFHEMHSSKDLVQGVKAFCIKNNKVVESVKLFKTRQGPVNELSIAYNFFTVAKRSERPVKLIYYDTDDEQLHLTVVKEDGTVTKELVTYQFMGKYFESVK